MMISSNNRTTSFSAINPVGDFLSPLWEGPTPTPTTCNNSNYHQRHRNHHRRRQATTSSASSWESLMNWMKDRRSYRLLFPHVFLHAKSSDPKLLLGVLACPLAPFPVFRHHHHQVQLIMPLCHKGIPLESSCAQYIIQQYIAAVGGLKLLNDIKNSYTRGKVRMLTTEFETATRVTKDPIKAAENGWFVLWQMLPDKWHVEMELEGHTVQSGSDGNVVWRSTSWLGAHLAKGPLRPLRRTMQGLDPVTIANVFIDAKCIGEKKIGDEDCFVLKYSVDPGILNLRRDGTSEVIRHTLNGYFSQKTGLLVFVEDSYLTRIQTSDNTGTVYWETNTESSIRDYRRVDGVNIAHSGHSVVTLFRFGEEAMSHTKTRMEEMWEIEEVAINVQGLSKDCFLPPSEVCKMNEDER